MQDEVRVTVIATGFGDSGYTAPLGGVVSGGRGGYDQNYGSGLVRPVRGGPSGLSGGSNYDPKDYEIPAFLRNGG